MLIAIPLASTLALLTLSASVIADASDSSCYFCYKGPPSNGKGQFPTYECGDKCGYKYYHTANDMKCWRSTHPMNDCFIECCEKEGKKAWAFPCSISYDC
ncbi:hypothetical protein ACJ73_09695 [Blastomyces percursus]|uniref:Uncharacterized protein n=1 Tax=Blastomyces percursus TaxID=1658174 RepID=A0A1J9Q4E7_9EURO|nr:hypothetical protein ACJ73_09695 [Blastomyces percursus]